MSFEAANAAIPDYHFYIEPKMAETLGEYLLGGKFCLVYGHRQSGKTTTILATSRWLQARSASFQIPSFACTGFEDYIISFSTGIKFSNGVDVFWKSICSKLRIQNQDRFSFTDSSASASTFQNFFRRTPSSIPIILFIDGASVMVGEDQAIIDSFIGMLRELGDRQKFCMHSVALVGFENIKELLIDPKNTISPFTAEACLTPDRFDQQAIVALLDQYAHYSGVELDSAEIAGDIYERTLGHKGLVGVVCSFLEMQVMYKKFSLSINDWRQYADVHLIVDVRKQATYSFIVRTLESLSSSRRDKIMNVLRHGSATLSKVSLITSIAIVVASDISFTISHLVKDDDLKFVLSEGILITTRDHENSVEVECAAPILRSIMLLHLWGPKVQLSVGPPNVSAIDAPWLLARTIEVSCCVKALFTAGEVIIKCFIPCRIWPFSISSLPRLPTPMVSRPSTLSRLNSASSSKMCFTRPTQRCSIVLSRKPKSAMMQVSGVGVWISSFVAATNPRTASNSSLKRPRISSTSTASVLITTAIFTTAPCSWSTFAHTTIWKDTGHSTKV